jgi:hypothetical protein
MVTNFLLEKKTNSHLIHQYRISETPPPPMQLCAFIIPYEVAKSP